MLKPFSVLVDSTLSQNWLWGKDDIFGAAPVLGTNAVVENLISLYRAFSINFLGCVCVVEVALKKSLIREAYNF